MGDVFCRRSRAVHHRGAAGLGPYALLVMLLWTVWPAAASAQAVSADTTIAPRVLQRQGAPLVYIDCGRCDYDHIRREITFVNYVRDPGQANVHVFITDEGTGGGGREYELSFLGQRGFGEMKYTFTHVVDRTATWDEEREGLNRVLKLGLMPYVVQMAGPAGFSLSYDADANGQQSPREVNDPWNHWVFNIYAGRLATGIESSQRYFDSRWGFYADRVTEDWKIRVRPYFNFHYVEIEQEGEEPVSSRRHRHGVDSYAIRSLSEHWSIGYFGDYITRNDRNLEHRYQINPGVEYSLLPYSVATRRSIVFRYRIGYTWADYYEETIFGKTREPLVNQQLEASVYVRQPWGDIQAGLEGSHYFHDFTHRRAEFYGNVSVRLTDGLSLDFGADFEVIQDQLSLPRGDSSLEDILLERRELATDFFLSGSVAISYTFGSQFASIVNTRF